ncbi:5-guanidino-2-oxopentanoate decarboxylase [Mesorhizobium sp. BAC0120]|uniref:5-guanidino-2-oxopentanoate decarboxylase n=1 Tax=Mesorhizobium sp. BAC0120 TaxID=3090670 RepID=UPI00298C8AD8|nr:5-guanidino-2-oxopentanoate decarboxylase [Mesorhizobium sp. BAC0120]MDW6023016.1 5-guanidino-2-oxopentanoate decarboxylase [Mesorhizobium sp. BAC0120]
MTNLATWIVQTLAANGVDTVFGIPGVHTIELYRALDGSGITHITPRHEQGAGFMADGYARVTGRPGVCFAITGPGLTNIATAMGQAYGDSIAMLVISTVNSAGAMGSGAGHLHELPDQQQLMSQVSAFSHTVLTVEEFPMVLSRALAIFASARPRPIHIEIPVDLLTADATRLGPARKLAVPSRPSAPETVLSTAAGLCERSARPLIIAGGGAVRAAEAIRELAERLDAPVLMTVNGRGILAGDHPLALPVWPGGQVGGAAMQEADLILAIGTELGPTDFEDRLVEHQSLSAPLIRCDVDAEQSVRGRLPDLPVVADASDFAGRLAARLPIRGTGQGTCRAARFRDALNADLTPRQRTSIRVIEYLRDSASGAVIVGDSTQPIYAACTAFAASAPAQFFCSATGYGTLGYALPAAIGAALGKPGSSPVFAVVGDGGLQFSLSEMGTAVEAGTNVIMILWNNRGYGEIKAHMERASVTPIGVDIHTPDFRLLANGYGWAYAKADNLRSLGAAISDAMALNRPAVVELDETSLNEAEEADSPGLG